MLTSASPDLPNPLKSAPASLQRNVSIDVLKLVLAFMVVGLHVGLLQDTTPLIGYLFGNGVFRIAVPIFFIINGFYFFPILQRGEARRWFSRVVMLYLFWTVIYGYFWIPPLEPSLFGIAKFFHTIVIGYFHLWYLSGMIGAALLVIVFRSSKPRVAAIVVLGLYGTGVFIQYAGNYHVFSGTVFDRIFNLLWVYRNFLFLGFPFFYIGFAINKYGLQKRLSSGHILLAVAIGAALLLFESSMNYFIRGSDGGYDNLAALLLICPAIFIAVHNCKLYSNQKRIATYSSGIYLVHMFVLQTLQPHVDIGLTAMTLLVMVVSIGITAALIPLSRRVAFVL
ncbi:acyltransferase [Pseudoduganella lutea]|uniref:Acyltransferase n=1 Tax=Pseudoduganella lutea TaxID=321985 RepID=A0A4P6KV15_9BURK|nr:acyltransferase family protein [Pseudoduganella lutea]QBE62505.1 acyltransferase [Pseudoduganella lutea]